MADSTDFFRKAITAVLNQSVRLSPKVSGRLAYRVLAAPRRRPLLPEERSFLLSSEKGRLRLPDFRIRTYHWKGEGPKVLLAHGWDSSTSRWEALGRQLIDRGYDLYALDAPGHGGSKGSIFTVVDYARCMHKYTQQVQPEVIIGHSAGGMAAVYYLTHEQKAFEPQQLILMATPGELTDFIETFQEALRLKEQVIHNLEQIFYQHFNRSFNYFSIAEFAKQLSMPGLVIHDQEDEVAPFDSARRIHHHWPQSELMITRGLGHSVQSEQVYARILRFLPPVG